MKFYILDICQVDFLHKWQMSNWHPHIIIIGSICVGYNHFCKRRNNLKRIVQQLHHKFVMICCLELSITPRRGNYWKTHIFCMIIFVASVKRMEENVSNFMTDHEKKVSICFYYERPGPKGDESTQTYWLIYKLYKKEIFDWHS